MVKSGAPIGTTSFAMDEIQVISTHQILDKNKPLFNTTFFFPSLPKWTKILFHNVSPQFPIIPENGRLSWLVKRVTPWLPADFPQQAVNRSDLLVNSGLWATGDGTEMAGTEMGKVWLYFMVFFFSHQSTYGKL